MPAAASARIRPSAVSAHSERVGTGVAGAPSMVPLVKFSPLVKNPFVHAPAQVNSPPAPFDVEMVKVPPAFVLAFVSIRMPFWPGEAGF